MECVEGNITALNASLSNAVQINTQYKLQTRGRCLSYYDENKSPLTMTCDHNDLQDWKVIPYQ